MTIDQYLDNLNKRYRLGNATEHTFRGDLQQLLESTVPGIAATNEPRRIKCGAPDYVLTRQDIPVGYIEAKDIGVELNHKSLKEQFDRYRASLPNLIFTDYLDFHLYIDGQFTASVRIGEVRNGAVVPLPEAFATFTSLIKNFCVHVGQTIRSSKKLAEMMAAKARLLADVIGKALTGDEASQENSTLREQMDAFRQILIHDISPAAFADVYAQTIAYGMFAARLHDPTLPTFSRQEAAELIPKSNPFLRKLFGYIAGPDLDDRIRWIVDGLIEIFLACNVERILKDYGSSTQTQDPIIHFYETFLSEYDPRLRKARGVWYTPAPVVGFIVRAVDDILKTEFGLPQGLADTGKITVTQKHTTKATADQRSKLKETVTEHELHRVQILDPATGTGTFLAEVVRHIHAKMKGQQGIWSHYVENHLLPRLNGFELLMASYAMAHLQLDLLLTETGYRPAKAQRLRVYLTNSLEESHPDTGTLFANWLSAEANEANHIKRDAPVMCVIGNPPYSGESANKGDWIMNLMEDYKREPGGKEKLKEKNPKWINDDYVKFLRYGQHFIEKNGSGVLAFINPHGFLDNPTFRGMRWNLLHTYDKIYTLDLHGNSKKKETAPDGSADVNVFDIMQGVSINIFVKTGRKQAGELGKVFHHDLYGKREMKYDFLSNTKFKDVPYTEIQNHAPDYLFIYKNDIDLKKYNSGLSLEAMFIKKTIGVQTHRDNLVVDFNKKHLTDKIKNLFDQEDLKFYVKKYEVNESANWNLKNTLLKEKKFKLDDVKPINYRPFDQRYIYYNDSFVDRTRRLVGKEIKDENIVLNFPKIVKLDWKHVLITQSIPTAISLDINGSYFAPLYVYHESNKQQSIVGQTETQPTRTPNLNPAIVQQIADGLGLRFVPEKETGASGVFAPIDLLDYIYAVLHSPAYRTAYKEFLKIDFPRVPYPQHAATFWQLVALGGQLRKLHLLETDAVDNYITQYPVGGDNVVGKIRYEAATGNVFINDTQYFGGVPQVAWEFYIGGYQPAQKWLKDRKDRPLGFEDILHYQKIIVALTETHRIMQEIDALGVV